MSLANVDFELQQVGRSLLKAMHDNLDDALDELWPIADAEDTSFYTSISEPIPVVPLQHVARYFFGHHPSILERPPADYPNVTVVAHRHRTAGDIGADQYEVVSNTAYAEAFLLHEDEEILNNLTNRYARAMNAVLMSLKDLGDSDVVPIDSAPVIDISNAAARRLEQFKEDIVYVQGCRIEHVFNTVGLW